MFAVLDLETKFLAQEVGGWHKAHKMGISCVGVYFSEKDSIVFFQDSELQKLWELLLKQDLIVGFNILGFDFKVLQGSLKRNWYNLPTLDLLLEIKKKLGYRLSLDHLAQYTLNAQKKGNGLLAVKWWREGKIEKIIEYCKHDVFLTKELYLFGRKNGYLCFKNKAGQIVHVPVHWR
ncbi:ribonuclease H-like domain-containing protein [Desulfonauticus submarinus]